METLIIDGVNIGAMCPQAGYTVSWDFVDGGQGDIMLDGTESVDELAQKEVITFPLLPLTPAQIKSVLSIVVPTPIHQVQYVSPHRGRIMRTMKRTLSTVKYRGQGGTGNEYWTGLVLTLRDK